ncbi:unnamed protein product [Gordionus sp. m RMFG-2023]
MLNILQNMYLITLLFLFILAGNALDKEGQCPIFQVSENSNSVTFLPNNVQNSKNKVYKSKLREATMWHNCVNCEVALSNQINLELRASYIYQLMAMHFDRDDVALKGFYKFFEHSSIEEREHASKLMKYMNKRGGNLLPHDIQKPDASKMNWESPLSALKEAFDLESLVYTSLRKLHDVASISEDYHV